MNINWYPGHMLKARRLISDNLKMTDAVCEIIDSRIPVSSRNPDLDELIAKKPRLIVMGRIDQADPAQSKKWAAHYKANGETVIEADCKSGRGIQNMKPALLSLLAEKTAAYASKGQAGRQLRIMVAGIPNVGKSSLINRAAKRKAAQTSDKPGVTRGKQWINLGNGIELLDTPGVLWPRLDDKTTAENLAFTGAIRDEIMDTETLGARLMIKLIRLYPSAITGRYGIDTGGINTDEDTDEGGFELLMRAAERRGFLISGGHPDTERMAIILLDEFRGGKLGRITLERI